MSALSFQPVNALTLPRIYSAAVLALAALWANPVVWAGDAKVLRPSSEVPADPERKAAARSLLHQIDEGFAAIYEQVAPSVVVIEARKRADQNEEPEQFDFFFKEGEEPSGKREPALRMPQAPIRSEGSGFILRADGYILTNQHVIAEAEKLEVRLKDGRVFAAKIVGSDDKSDIAVIKLEAKDLPVVEFADSERLRIGQLVAAIGTPYNQDFSFTCGWVSGKGRTNLLGASSNTILYEDYIQTDAFINPGNSGGPLFDVDGKVVGMNTLINGVGRGLAFAIPSNMLVEVSSQLIARGRVQRPWLGIRIESLRENRELRDRVKLEQGIVVRTIEANAPAYRSDLRPADIILEMDGVKLATAHDLQKEVLKKKVGQTVQLSVWRGGNILKIPVMTGELPGDYAKVAAPGKRGLRPEYWGLKLRDAIKGGAQVVEVTPQSPAALAGIQPDDVINEVESKPITDVGELLMAMSAFEGKDKKALLLNIERKGKRTFAMLEKPK